MKLVCHIGDINGLFEIVQGSTFSDEFNESLDSGNIIIVSRNKRIGNNGLETELTDSDSKQLNIKPYDDVIIFDLEENPNGYDGWGANTNYQGNFYRHLLINNFSEEMIYQGDTSSIATVIFKYKISLMSETKKLEKIVVPRLSITQPIKNGPKRFIWEYLHNYLELYNPQIKRKTNDGWTYSGKYSYCVDDNNNDNLNLFKKIWCPEFTLGESTFKELLTELFQVADRIPYVKDDVIYALDISNSRGDFDTTKGQINFPIRSMSSEDYCTNLRTTYSDALPQEYSGHSIEYIGFRNSDEAIMTLDNMRVELNFPIYKINHVYMHYYKTGNISLINVDGEILTINNYPILITQDITKLVRLSNEPLSKDWKDFNENPISSIEDAAKFDFSTVRYTQGSKYITGWGTKYQYPYGEWMDSQTKTHIENIIRLVDNLKPYGTVNLKELSEQVYNKMIKNVPNYANYRILSLTLTGQALTEPDIASTLLKNFFGTAFDNGNPSETMKHMFFTVDYQPFYNGAIVHSKGEDINENLTSVDNPNNSLSLLERDGIAQREKLERFGVSTVQLSARYTDINDLQEVGTKYNSPYQDDLENRDIIIYHREYSVFDNVINCSYYGSKEYVLKNYYTSVFSKYRIYNLMSYGESVTRSENKKYYIKLGINEQNSFNDNLEGELTINNIDNNVWLSALLPTTSDSKEALNNAYYYVPKYSVWNSSNSSFEINNNGGYFVTDFISFSTGNSIVFNISMPDNITGGTYWETTNKDIDWVNNVETDLKGTTQNQYYVADYNDGTLFEIQFGLFNSESLAIQAINGVASISNNSAYVDDTVINKDIIMKRPFVPSSSVTNSNESINVLSHYYKDNKEVINLSLQFEYLCSENIFISPWFGRLNDLITRFYKQTNPEITKEQDVNTVYGLKFGYAYETIGENSFNNLAVHKISYKTNNSSSPDSNVANNNYNDIGIGYNGDNENLKNGSFYMTPNFYQSVSGSSISDTSGGYGVLNEFKIQNPVLLLQISKNKYEGIEDSNFELDYNFGSIVINNASPHSYLKGNPYYRNDNTDYITNLVITPKKIKINKQVEDFGIQESKEEYTTSNTTYTYDDWYVKPSIKYANVRIVQKEYEDDGEIKYYNQYIVNPVTGSSSVTTPKSFSYGGLTYNFFVKEGNDSGISINSSGSTSGQVLLTSNGNKNGNFDLEFNIASNRISETNKIKNLEDYVKGEWGLNDTVAMVYEYFITIYYKTPLGAYGYLENTTNFWFVSLNSFDYSYRMSEDGTAYSNFRPLPLDVMYAYATSQLPSDAYDIDYRNSFKGDFIKYTDSFNNIKAPNNLYEGSTTSTTTYQVENRYEYSFAGQNISNYIIADIEYETKSGNNYKVTNRKLILNRQLIDNYYYFSTAIRWLPTFSATDQDDLLLNNPLNGKDILGFNPAQIDILYSTTENKKLYDGDNIFSDNSNELQNLTFGDSKFWNSYYSTTSTSGNTTTTNIYSGFPAVLYEIVKRGLTSNISLNQDEQGTGILGDKFVVMNEFSFSRLPSVFTVDDEEHEQIPGYKIYGNLYYVLIKIKLDDKAKYQKYYLTKDVNGTKVEEDNELSPDDKAFAIEIENYTDKISIQSQNDTVTIDINDSININNYQSFAVFYKSNEQLGVWDDDNRDSYAESTNLHFVFGINLDDDKIINKKHFIIKSSILKSRDKRVYDNKNKLTS
ncbi:MAG: hypothetical protein IKF82_01235 [Bacilli bacterium]|nr:hypothetical protein [Bacilli bacterium]